MAQKPPTKLVKRVPRPPAEVRPMSPETWDLRQQVLRKYGGKCVCVCGCRCADLRLLQLHHGDGEGTKDRKVTRGINLYRRLLMKDVDQTLHLLCVSCHWMITMFGCCDNELTGGDTEPNEPQHEPVEPPVAVPVVDPFSHLREETLRQADADRLAADASQQQPRSRWRHWGRRHG